MRWVLLVLVVALTACLGAEYAQKAAIPPAEKPVETVQPVVPSQNVYVPQQVPELKKEGVSVREVLPATVMDYTNFTFYCSAGFCSGRYKSRLVGNENSVLVEFYGSSTAGQFACNPAKARVSEVHRNRTLIWCNTTNTKERFVSSLWWSEPELGYVSIVSEDYTRAFSDSTRAKNSDFAANSTAIYIMGRLDYFVSAGKAIVLEE